MSSTILSGLPACRACQSGNTNIVRLIVRSEVQGAKYWLHIHEDEDLSRLLSRLCALYPSEWQPKVVYNVYVDNGGIYYPVDSAFWIRDKDHILVTTIDDVSDIPDVDMNAVHAKLRGHIRLLPHQEEGIQQMIQMEQTFRGGILADEMGLGKVIGDKLSVTLQVLTTVLRQQPKLEIGAKTLIIVPSYGIAYQWAEEIRTKSNYGSLPYFIYQEDTMLLLDQPCFKIIITTYDRVRSEYKRRYLENLDSPLFDTTWHRVVLDECNKLRSLKAKLCDSIVGLTANFRWCLTGTPLQNDISELFPIFRFLRINLPVADRNKVQLISELLRKHMIRRKKTNLQQALDIRPKKEIRVVLEFTPPERALYDYLEQILYKQLRKIRNAKDLSEDGLAASLLYLRLKQACDHHQLLLSKFPDLIPITRTRSNEEVASLLQKRSHIAWNSGIRRDNDNELLQVCDVIEDYYDQCEEGQTTQPNMDELEKLPFITHSTKVQWLIRFLNEQLEKSPNNDKIVVVSQFVDFLTMISKLLKSINIIHENYFGDMPNRHRKSSLERFNFRPQCQVLLLSLKAGGVGLNLQCANHMVLLDRWWNPATMDQAVARIHRMNQSKQTYIYTVIIKDTIEEGLLEGVLLKKNELFTMVVDGVQPMTFSTSEQLLEEKPIDDDDVNCIDLVNEQTVEPDDVETLDAFPSAYLDDRMITLPKPKRARLSLSSLPLASSPSFSLSSSSSTTSSTSSWSTPSSKTADDKY